MASLKHIPFAYHWIVRRAIGDGIKTVIDLGCGEGDFMKDISQGENWEISGVELYGEAASKARKTGIYKKVIKADVRKLPKSILNKKYDLVFSSQVLEHIAKAKGERALKNWEKLAKKRIVVTTPVGFIEYDPIEKKTENNPLQEHRSGWDPEEFKNAGYKVKGQGSKLIYGPRGLARNLTKFLSVFRWISYLISPLVYFYPKLATYMVAYKDVKDDK